jgi:hypothetical protein
MRAPGYIRHKTVRGDRTPDAAMRTSPSHVYYPWQISYDGDLNSLRGLYIKAVQPKSQDARSIKFF